MWSACSCACVTFQSAAAAVCLQLTSVPACGPVCGSPWAVAGCGWLWLAGCGGGGKLVISIPEIRQRYDMSYRQRQRRQARTVTQPCRALHSPAELHHGMCAGGTDLQACSAPGCCRPPSCSRITSPSTSTQCITTVHNGGCGRRCIMGAADAGGAMVG